jgi:hypothetical protein
MLTGCQNEENRSAYNVSGKLTSEGKLLEDASVDIDGLEQYKTETNTEGFFLIKQVTIGAHDLNTYKRLEDGSFIKKSYGIVLTDDDLNLEALLLPNPVCIDTIVLDSTTNKATIKWNRSTADDFREYKLYSHATSGLDETTGLLEHVATSVYDTVKEIQLSNNTESFFRVFILNDYGQLGGSNIKSVQGLNLNLLPGGDFEDQRVFDDYWNILSGSVALIDTDYYEGSSCLHMRNVIIPEEFSVEESLVETSVRFESNTMYEISFWYRLTGIARMDYHTLYFYYYQDEANHIETNLSFEPDGDSWTGSWVPDSPFLMLDDTGWLFYSKTFVPESDSPAIFRIGGQVENILIDHLTIKNAA